mgnify:CR=1 FL=1
MSEIQKLLTGCFQEFPVFFSVDLIFTVHFNHPICFSLGYHSFWGTSIPLDYFGRLMKKENAAYAFSSYPDFLISLPDSPVSIFKTGDHIAVTFYDHIRNIISVPDRIADDIFQLIIHNDIKILLDHLKRDSLILLCILHDKIKNLLFHIFRRR